MHVIRADALGMCFGVRDALAEIGQLSEPGRATIHGELVHNETVLAELRERGFRETSEADRTGVPGTELVVITAHGISEREHARLLKAGKRLLDTTCPLVTRVHKAARALQSAGCHVLVIGQPGHVEVRGIVEDLESFDVIETAQDVKQYACARLGIVCQSTAAPREVAEIRRAIAAKNPGSEIRFVDTVCQPTKDRQAALERLLTQVDVMVIVGGRNSNNTRKLVALCREQGIQAFHVQGACDLDLDWFVGCRTVGLTAGTSTLDATVEEVHQAIRDINTK